MINFFLTVLVFFIVFVMVIMIIVGVVVILNKKRKVQEAKFYLLDKDYQDYKKIQI